MRNGFTWRQDTERWEGPDTAAAWKAAKRLVKKLAATPAWSGGQATPRPARRGAVRFVGNTTSVALTSARGALRVLPARFVLMSAAAAAREPGRRLRRAVGDPMPLLAMNRTEHRRLWLTLDAVAPLRCTQDSRDCGPDPDDIWFGRHHGLSTGFLVWMGAPEAPIWRVVESRSVFADAARASEYLRDNLASLSEGASAVASAPAVGDACRVFGGPREVLPGARSCWSASACWSAASSASVAPGVSSAWPPPGTPAAPASVCRAGSSLPGHGQRMCRRRRA